MPRTPPDESFGQRLLRQARDYSQRELGEIVSVSQRMMTYYEPVKAQPATRRNTRLWRKLRDIEKLPPGDRKAVLKFVDALLVRQKVAGGSR
jgi:hypothetical protein